MNSYIKSEVVFIGSFFVLTLAMVALAGLAISFAYRTCWAFQAPVWSALAGAEAFCVIVSMLAGVRCLYLAIGGKWVPALKTTALALTLIVGIQYGVFGIASVPELHYSVDSKFFAKVTPAAKDMAIKRFCKYGCQLFFSV